MSTMQPCRDAHTRATAADNNGNTPSIEKTLLDIIREGTQQNSYNQQGHMEYANRQSTAYSHLGHPINTWTDFDTFISPPGPRSEMFQHEKTTWRSHIQRLVRQYDLDMMRRKLPPVTLPGTQMSHHARYIHRTKPTVIDLESNRNTTKHIYAHWSIREFASHVNLTDITRIRTGNSTFLMDKCERGWTCPPRNRICAPCLFNSNTLTPETSEHVLGGCCHPQVHQARNTLDANILQFCRKWNQQERITNNSPNRIKWIPYATNPHEWLKAIHLEPHAEAFAHSIEQRIPDNTWIPVIRQITTYVSDASSAHTSACDIFNSIRQSGTAWSKAIDWRRNNRRTTIRDSPLIASSHT
jgi:hypothetical protein